MEVHHIVYIECYSHFMPAVLFLCQLLNAGSARKMNHKRVTVCLSIPFYQIVMDCRLSEDTGGLYEGESIITRTVCFIFRKTWAEILQLHNFSTQSPCFTMHFVHHRTIRFITSDYKVLCWQTSHTRTVTSSCWSVVNRRPHKACLSGPNRWVWRCKVKTIQGMLQYLKV
jgi:hypothetical protein